MNSLDGPAQFLFEEYPAMIPAVRSTGVNVQGDMPWGSYVCVFYESKQDLLDTAISSTR